MDVLRIDVLKPQLSYCYLNLVILTVLCVTSGMLQRSLCVRGCCTSYKPMSIT